MGFKAFKNFPLYRSKDKGKEKQKSNAPEVERVGEIASTASDIDKIEVSPVRPHGPILELSLDPEDVKGDKKAEDDADVDVLPPAGTAPIKVVNLSAEGAVAPVAEVKIEAVPPAPPPPPEKKESKKPDEESLNNLFGKDEEEENPLASLINSLPDVTPRELLDDIEEIKGIIKDWQKK